MIVEIGSYANFTYKDTKGYKRVIDTIGIYTIGIHGKELQDYIKKISGEKGEPDRRGDW